MAVRPVGMQYTLCIWPAHKLETVKRNFGFHSQMDVFVLHISQYNTSFNTLLYLITSPAGGKK